MLGHETLKMPGRIGRSSGCRFGSSGSRFGIGPRRGNRRVQFSEASVIFRQPFFHARDRVGIDLREPAAQLGVCLGRQAADI
jgi:hypothetical protein